MMMKVPCSLVRVDRRFRDAYCLRHQCDDEWVIITLMMVAVCTSETLVNFNETTRRYTPEGSHLQNKTCRYAHDVLLHHTPFV
jgi:hypothetical protein